MVMFNWLVGVHQDKEESRFGTTVSGTLYVMIPGTLVMQMLYAANLDTEEQ